MDSHRLRHGHWLRTIDLRAALGSLWTPAHPPDCHVPLRRAVAAHEPGSRFELAGCVAGPPGIFCCRYQRCFALSGSRLLFRRGHGARPVHDLPCVPDGANCRTECRSAPPALRELARCIWISCAVRSRRSDLGRSQASRNPKPQKPAFAGGCALTPGSTLCPYPTHFHSLHDESELDVRFVARVREHRPPDFCRRLSRAPATRPYLCGVCGCDGRRDVCKRTPCRASRDAPDLTFRACSVYFGHIRTRRNRLVRHRVFADLYHSAVDHAGVLSPGGVKLRGHSDAADGVDRGQRRLFARRHQYDRRCRSRFPHRSSMVRVRILFTSGLRVLWRPRVRPRAHG